MENTIKKLNLVLTEWNPIGVDPDIASDEYQGYIPMILKYIEDSEQLFHFLENILIRNMEIGYDPTNKDHIMDLKEVRDKLIAAFKSREIT